MSNLSAEQLAASRVLDTKLFEIINRHAEEMEREIVALGSNTHAGFACQVIEERIDYLINRLTDVAEGREPQERYHLTPAEERALLEADGDDQCEGVGSAEFLLVPRGEPVEAWQERVREEARAAGRRVIFLEA